MTIGKLFFALSAVAVTLFASTSANAQEEEKTHPSSYNRIALSYRNVNLSSGGANFNLNGGSFDYIHGFGVTRSLPIYVETGASAAFTTKDTGSGSYAGYMTIDVPVNCAYIFYIPNSEISISPFLGLNFKGNIIGTNDVASDTQEWYDEGNYRRFQLGWNIGAGMNYKKFYVGLSYGTDFVQIAKKVNCGTFKLSLGLNI